MAKLTKATTRVEGKGQCIASGCVSRMTGYDRSDFDGWDIVVGCADEVWVRFPFTRAQELGGDQSVQFLKWGGNVEVWQRDNGDWTVTPPSAEADNPHLTAEDIAALQGATDAAKGMSSAIGGMSEAFKGVSSAFEPEGIVRRP